MQHNIEQDPLVRLAIETILSQTRKGLKEYGIPLSKAELPLSKIALLSMQEAADQVIYNAAIYYKALALEQSGENAPLSTKIPPISNAEELTTKENGQTAYDLLADSLLAQHQAFEAHEIRRTWRTLYQLPDGSTLCKLIKNAIESEQGVEYLKPDGDPIEKLNAIKVVGKGGKEALQTLFEACGHKVKFVNVTDNAEFREANRKAGTGEPE